MLQWGGDDAFTHMMVVGPTRCGKTATVLKPMIYQILKAKKAGKPVGMSVVEPKGDVAAMVREMCEAMEIPFTHVDPSRSDTHVFNPMQGDTDDVAEATVAVLKSLFGKQEAFFATVQELSARNVTKLLKELHGDAIDLVDVVRCLRDEEELNRKISELERLKGETDLVQFFKAELLGSLKDHFRKLVLGLRAQIENLTSNQYLKRVMQGNSDIKIADHFEKGGVLAVSTSLGLLQEAGDAFGQFVIMHLQSGTFRRKGTEKTRVPHYLIVDEYSRYINPKTEIFLSIAAEYRVAGIFATQSLAQLEVESGKIGPKAMKQAILTSCRNKIAFGGLSAQDAKEFAEEFGKDLVMEKQKTYEGGLIPHLLPSSYRLTEKEKYRFYQTQLMDGLPRFHYVHKLLQQGHPQPPGLAKGNFVPRNWKEQLVNDKKFTFDFKQMRDPEKIKELWDKLRKSADHPAPETVKEDNPQRVEQVNQVEVISTEQPLEQQPFIPTRKRVVPPQRVIQQMKHEQQIHPPQPRVIQNHNDTRSKDTNDRELVEDDGFFKNQLN